MDWMTLAITAVGALIFCIWVIIPIREYRIIFRRLRRRAQEPDSSATKRNYNDGA